MIEEPLLSICIPTYKRPEIVKQLLNSIYSQKVDESLYNICITDNSETDETKDVIEQDFHYYLGKNLYYKKTTCQGFYNSIEALKFGTGNLLKLHNDYSLFKEGTLLRLIEQIKENKNEKPLLFYSLGVLKDRSIISFNDYNSFMYHIGYYATWSSSFSMWKEDRDRLYSKSVEENYMYPHTTLLHKMVYKNKYIVDDYDYFDNIQPKKKGGYNLVDNFVRIYLTMVKEDLLNKKYIDNSTYKKIQKGILQFVVKWDYSVKRNSDFYTFRFDNMYQIIEDTCGGSAVLYTKIYYVLYCLGIIPFKIIRKVRAK